MCLTPLTGTACAFRRPSPRSRRCDRTDCDECIRPVAGPSEAEGAGRAEESELELASADIGRSDDAVCGGHDEHLAEPGGLEMAAWDASGRSGRGNRRAGGAV